LWLDYGSLVKFYEDGLKMGGVNIWQWVENDWSNMICETPVMGFFEWALGGL